jgi:16S rRNA (cytosine967-C5)-methyltransferase
MRPRAQNRMRAMAEERTRPDQQARVDPPFLYAGPRGIAVKILNRVERTDSYLDKVLDAELRLPDLSDLDKGLLSEIVHGVLRWQGRLDWILNGFSHGNFAKSEINVKNTLRVALYQILFLDRIPHAAAVNEGVEFIKRIRGDKPAGLVNAVLRNIIRNIEGIRYPELGDDQVQYLSVYYSHPQWMVRRWVGRYGAEETAKLLAANNERPDLSLRVNRLKSTPGAFRETAERQQIKLTPSSLLEYFFRTKSLTRIGQMELFRGGYFTIQDESAALPCLLLDPRPGERVLDLCAAPGGKTTNLAELMRNQGEIIAVDKYEAKLRMIQGSCDRLGLRNVSLHLGDAEVLDLPPANRVLLDAPCSGLGVLTKKPDIKWKRDIADIRKLAAIQTSMINNAARLVGPGGVLVYCTCTTEPEENEEIVQRFLQTHSDFELEPAGRFVPASFVSNDGFLRTMPHVHGMDGSFAARLLRNASSAVDSPR